MPFIKQQIIFETTTNNNNKDKTKLMKFNLQKVSECFKTLLTVY